MKTASTALAILFAAFKAVPAEPMLPDTSNPQWGLDLADIRLTPLYEADFAKPQRIMTEADLFEDDKRVRKPDGAAWVLEGKAGARIENGRLRLENEGGHLVCWNTHTFPADFLLEFDVSPANADSGLNIVFFAAVGRDGGGIFDLQQPRRDGNFKTYHSGGLNCYHTSYWATDAKGAARGTAHIRKNHGFHLVAQGRDFITGAGPGPHRVRVLKLGGRIEIEVNGKIAIRWIDDGRAFGPVLGSGLIGLRQMAHSKECGYARFKVWAAAAK